MADQTRAATLTDRRRRRNAQYGQYKSRACPCCDAALPELVSGEQTCRACRRNFRAAAFDPVEDPGPTVVPAGTGTPCAKHAGNLAVSSCQRCGAFMCSLCQIDTDGREYCADCFNRLSAEGALASAVVRIRNYNLIAGMLGLLGLLLWFLGILCGPAAVFYAIRGMRQRRRTGESLSVAWGWAGLILGVIEFLGSIAIILVLIARR